jgi:hypothetical protein
MSLISNEVDESKIYFIKISGTNLKKILTSLEKLEKNKNRARETMRLKCNVKNPRHISYSTPNFDIVDVV